MPLGNLTSQFFANIYLNELDYFIKNKLRIRFYIRYVDDFVILNKSLKELQDAKEKIDNFLKCNLLIELHPEKSATKKLSIGIGFLGMRIFYHHKLIKRKNLRKFQNGFLEMKKMYEKKVIESARLFNFIHGWFAFMVHANTYNYRNNICLDYIRIE